MTQMVESPPQTNRWRDEIREILGWIKDNAVFCAAAAIALPGISVFHYTQHEHVPVSITSSEMLAVLPLVLAVIVLVTVIVSGAMLIPLSAMFEYAKRAPDGRWHLLPPRERGRRKAALLWLAALTGPGIIVATAAVFVDSSSGSGRWKFWLAIFLATVIYTGITQWLLPGREHKRTVDSFFSASLMGSFCQMLLNLTAMQLALRALDPTLAKGWIYAALIVTTIVLALVQLFFAAMIEVTSMYGGVIKQACTATAALVAALCLFPYTGASLAGYVISGSASGGADCVQLTLSTGSSDFNALLEPGTERKTHSLKLLANVDDTYLVRTRGEERGTVYRIPAANVIALTACPSPRKDNTQKK